MSYQLGYNADFFGQASYINKDWGLGIHLGIRGHAGTSPLTHNTPGPKDDSHSPTDSEGIYGNIVHTPQIPPAPAMAAQLPAPRPGEIQDFVKTMYQNILDRNPESQTVVDNWTRHTYAHGLAETLRCFFTSDEYRAKSLSTETTVDKFYLSVLGRQAEPGGRAYWIGAIRDGMSLHKVAEGFVGSQEYQQKVQAGTAPHPIHWP